MISFDSGNDIDSKQHRTANPRTVAVISFALEANCFNPEPRCISSFQRLESDAYEQNERQAGFVRTLRSSEPELFQDVDIRFVCLFRGWCGGLIPSDDWACMVGVAVTGLQRLLADRATGSRIDGVYLDLHGAMGIADRGASGDAEAELVEALRAAVPIGLIAASFDLHGNFSERLGHAFNIVAAYKTMPHIDMEETKSKALRMLLQCLQNDWMPALVMLRVPISLPGGCVLTTEGPGVELYDTLKALESKTPGLLDASLFVGHTFANEERVGGAVVFTGQSADVAEERLRGLSQEVAQRYWDVRRQCLYPVDSQLQSWEDALNQLYAAYDAGEFALVADVGDNTNAGASGDVPFLLRKLIACQATAAAAASANDNMNSLPTVLIADLVDATAVQACADALAANSSDAEIATLTVGASHARPSEANYGAGCGPVTLRNVRVRSIVNDGAWAIVELGAINITLVLQRSAWAFFSEGDLARLTHEFHPHRHDAAIFKGGVNIFGLASACVGNHQPRTVRRVLANTPGAAYEPPPYRSNVNHQMYPENQSREWTAPLGELLKSASHSGDVRSYVER